MHRFFPSSRNDGSLLDLPIRLDRMENVQGETSRFSSSPGSDKDRWIDDPPTVFGGNLVEGGRVSTFPRFFDRS